MKNKWRTTPPDNFTGPCLITMETGGRRWVTEGWVDEDNGLLRLPPQAIAWMPMPEHCSTNADGWLSEYRGDNLPDKNGWYVVCEDGYTFVHKRLFNVKTQSFVTRYEALAWMPLPEPYKGVVV